MNTRSLKHFSEALILTVALTGCGALKNMDEMHDSTQKMATTTDSLNAKTAQMMETTNQLLEITKKMQVTTNDMSGTTGKMLTVTQGMAKTTGDMSGTTQEMLGVTQGMAKTTDTMATTTGQMLGVTQGMAKTTDTMAGTTGQMLTVTQGMAKTTDDMSHTTQQMLGVTQGMANTTGEMLGVTKGMAKTTNEMAGTTGQMLTTTNKMADTTGQMLTTTNKMAGTTGKMLTLTQGMSKTTENMNRSTTGLYRDARMGSSSTRRQDAITAMNAAPTIGEKFAWAGTYFFAMEFQFWKPTQDDLEMRELMFANMVTEFFNTVQTYAVDLGDFDVSSTANNRLSLMALAAAMDQVNNETQSKPLKDAHSKEPIQSMYSLITESLAAKVAYEKEGKATSTLPAHMQMVFTHYHFAVYLLQMRQSALKALGMSLAHQKNNGTDGSKVDLLMDWTRSRFNRSWTPNLEHRTLNEVKLMADAFEGSVKTIEFLNSIGLDPAPQKMIDSLIASMRMPQTLEKNASGVQGQINRYAEQREELLKLSRQKNYKDLKLSL